MSDVDYLKHFMTEKQATRVMELGVHQGSLCALSCFVEGGWRFPPEARFFADGGGLEAIFPVAGVEAQLVFKPNGTVFYLSDESTIPFEWNATLAMFLVAATASMPAVEKKIGL